jgi:hypothetical protein
VVSDVPVDDEASVVTSIISRSVAAQSFGGAHRGRVCVRVCVCIHRGECVCIVPCNLKKTNALFGTATSLIR